MTGVLFATIAPTIMSPGRPASRYGYKQVPMSWVYSVSVAESVFVCSSSKEGLDMGSGPPTLDEGAFQALPISSGETNR